MTDLSWKIGEVTVTRIVEGDGSAPIQHVLEAIPPEEIAKIAWLKPHFVHDDWRLKGSVHALVVEAPGTRLIVDTCVGNDKDRSRFTHWGWHEMQSRFLDDLVAAGFAPDSFDAVMCTHLHMDHVGWNTRLEGDRWVPTFPQARYLLAEAELSFWQQSKGRVQTQVMADSVQPIFDAGLAETVATDHALTPEIRLIPTPGHTPGHVSVLIESAGEQALITGDFIHHPCQFHNPDWSSGADTDQAQAARTRWDVFGRYADAPTLVIGTHFAGPSAGRLVRDGKAFRLDV